MIADPNQPPDRFAVHFPKHGTNQDGRFIDIYHPLYETLAYPLIYAFGGHGWYNLNGNKFKTSAHSVGGIKNMELLDYYRQMILRCTQLQLCGRLLNVYALDAFSRWQKISLNYIGQQLQKRIATFRELQGRNDGSEGLPGRKLLPASVPGSKRYQRRFTQDALAIVALLGKPSYFITFTANPQWPEVKEMLLSG